MGLLHMRKSEVGYTLIELMIGLLVGLIVLSGVIYAMLLSLSSSRNVLNSARLNQEVSTLNDIIVGEVKRAGYWPTSVASSAIDSPYGDGSEIAIAVPESGCVLYSYDMNGDQSLTNSEKRGFKLESVSGVGVIKLRVSGSAMDDCSDGDWSEWLTDESFMDVRSFAVTETENCLLSDGGASVACGAVSSAFVSVRELGVSLEAEVVADPDWKASFQDVVKVRNNKVID